MVIILVSISFLMNSLCHGVYKLIDPVENALFILGSILGYYLHTKYFVPLSLQHVIDENKVKKYIIMIFKKRVLYEKNIFCFEGSKK